MPPRQGERDVMYQTIDEIHDLRSVKAIRRMQDTASMSRKAKPFGLYSKLLKGGYIGDCIWDYYRGY